VFPLRDVSRDELAELAGGELARVAPVDGGIVNTIHDVTRVDGAPRPEACVSRSVVLRAGKEPRYA